MTPTAEELIAAVREARKQTVYVRPSLIRRFLKAAEKAQQEPPKTDD